MALDDGEIADVRPLLSSYAMLMKCKSLGLTMDASAFSPEDVDMLQTIQAAVEAVQQKQRAGHGGQ